MSGTNDAGIRIALINYDRRVLRVFSKLLEGSAFCAACACYQEGGAFLRDMRSGMEFDLVILGRRLPDMENETFIRRHAQEPVPYKPIVLMDNEYSSLENLSRILNPSRKRGAAGAEGPGAVLRIIQALRYDRADGIRTICEQLCAAWGITSRGQAFEDFTAVVTEAVRCPEETELQKGVFLPVAERRHASIGAVENSIRRMQAKADRENTAAWQELIRPLVSKNAGGKERLEPKEWIKLVRDEVVRREVAHWQEEGQENEMDTT